jgi:hypothetical protein
VQGKARALDGAIFFHSFGCVLGATREKTATAAQHWADRVSVEAYQRKQHVFHRIIVEMKWLCSTSPGFPAPWLAGRVSKA